MSAQPRIHPEMALLVEGKKAMNAARTPEETACAFARYTELTQRPRPIDMQVDDRFFPGPEGGRIPVRHYRPRRAVSPAPCILYFHGGGFMLGDLDSSDTVAWGIAESVGAHVISVHYRLAPRHPFPAAPEDAFAVLRHVAGNAERLGIDADRIGTWGDSAGGNLATVTCLMTRDRGGPPVRAQVLVAAALSDLLDSDSYRVHAHSPGLTTAGVDFFWGQYLGERRPSREPYATPLAATDLSGLPPALVHIAEIDPLADDGRRYVERLRAAGVEAELQVAERMIHGFLRARHIGPGAAAEFETGCAFMRERLIRSPWPPAPAAPVRGR